MRISLDRKGDYSVRAMIDLARSYQNGRRKAREIARTMDIPERYLPQLLAPFVREGLLSATAGPEGGYALVVPPSSVSLLRVIEMAEGSLESPHCVLQGGPCDWEGVCPVHDAWVRGRAALARELDATDLSQLAEIDAALQQGDIPEPSVPLHPVAVPRLGKRDGNPEARPRASRSGG
jgi:Rrf2 family protein